MTINKLYFDMDGVLADFDKGVVDLCGLPAPDTNNPDKNARKIMWKKIKGPFWRQELWDHVQSLYLCGFKGKKFCPAHFWH